MRLKTVAIVGLAAGLLAACADYQARDRAARSSAAPSQVPAAAMDPGTNAGQTTSPVSGSVSNTASGSQATPSAPRPLR